jgi:hypothetical protein
MPLHKADPYADAVISSDALPSLALVDIASLQNVRQPEPDVPWAVAFGRVEMWLRDAPSDNRRSIYPQARQRSCPCVERWLM